MRNRRRRGFWGNLGAQLTREIGIDLGTANTLVHVAGRGVVLREPSVVAISKLTGEVLAVGLEAKEMVGRTPDDIITVRPLRDGVIADFDQTMKMLQYFIGKVSRRSVLRQVVVVGIPSGVTEVERRAVVEASKKAGATHAYVIEEPMAAAIGAGLPVEEAVGSMIVDIGGGTTEVAVISLGGIVKSRSIRIAGDEMDEAIIAHAKRAYNLSIGEITAEEVKIAIGTSVPLKTRRDMEITGRDLLTGLPQTAVITSEEVRGAISEAVNAIVEAVKVTLEDTPPELAADCKKHGIVLAGGGAMLRGLDYLISSETSVPVVIAQDPLGCVVRGTGMVVESLKVNKNYRRMLLRASKL